MNRLYSSVTRSRLPQAVRGCQHSQGKGLSTSILGLKALPFVVKLPLAGFSYGTSSVMLRDPKGKGGYTGCKETTFEFAARKQDLRRLVIYVDPPSSMHEASSKHFTPCGHLSQVLLSFIVQLNSSGQWM